MNDKAAFPMLYNTRQGSELDLDIDPGMNIREYFSAKAMQGLLANPNVEVREVDGAFLPFVPVKQPGGGTNWVEAWRVAGCTIDTFIGAKDGE